MSFADMVRVCALSGAAIVATMLLLGTMMIAQKPEARLILAETPAFEVPVPAAMPVADPAAGEAPQDVVHAGTGNASL